VVAGAAGVVDAVDGTVVTTGLPGEGAAKATTWSAAGTSSRPAPTPGVGKWLAATPTVALWTTAPVAGASPYSVPF
jgi:hypothetical protein